MKKKYSTILKESLVNFDGIQKSTGTVDDILNFKGKGNLPTHKKASNVVSVLEDMYYKEDNDVPSNFMREGEETEVAVGTKAVSKIVPDIDKEKVSDLNKADGAAHANPQKQNQFKDTIVDASTDDKTYATEDMDDLGEDLEEGMDDLGVDLEEDGDIEESLFEEGDADLDSEPIGENLENEPDHEAQGDPSRDINADNSYNNNNTLGDEEINGMEEETEGLPKTMESDGDLMGEMDDELDSEEDEDEDDLSSLPDDAIDGGGEDDDISEMEDESEVGGDEEIDDGMDDEVEAEPEANLSDEEDLGGGDDLGDEGFGDEAAQIDAQIADLVAKKLELQGGAASTPIEGEENLGGEEDLGSEEDLGDTSTEDEADLASVPGEEDDIDEAEEDLGEEEDGEEEGEEEPKEGEGEGEGEGEDAPILDVDGADAGEEDEDEDDSVATRESIEESVVERLIREMKLEESSDYSEVDLDIDDIED